MKVCGSKKSTDDDWNRILRYLHDNRKKSTASMKEKHGSYDHTLLHFVLRAVVSREFWEKRQEVVRIFLERYPDALEERDIAQYLPLHMVCASKDIDPDLLRLLISKAPEHIYARCNSKNDDFADVLDGYEDEFRSNPLHIACEWNPTVEVISAFTDNTEVRDELSYKCLTKEDGHLNLPLHIAVDKAADLHAIKFLVREWKRLGGKKHCFDYQNCNGYTPLHYACFHGVSLETFQFLVKKRRGTIWLVDNDGDLPINFVLSDKPSNNGSDKTTGERCLSSIATKAEKIKILLEAAEETDSANHMLNMRNKKGETPLHVACTFCESWIDTVQLLLDKGGNLCKARDNNGNTPLHLALYYGITPHIVYQLITKEGCSILLEENNEGKVPEDIAMLIQKPTPRQTRMIQFISEKTEEQRYAEI
mmetsp:Transcript_34882/g.80663  ORF Transcript_34882/g.80663 Transcript_34882/m.80663 type:complete len:421 (+) Transcript_34882:601-1863(+)